jgi:hypothetical protein
MKTSSKRPGKSGYISYVMVLSTGIMLMLSAFYAYRRAVNAQEVQSKVRLRVDYSEKEDAVLRGIVAITPNRVMEAMMHDSNDSAINETWRWRKIFGDALTMANAKTSVSSDVVTGLGLANHIQANVGDTTVLSDASRIFSAIDTVNSNDISEYCTSGLEVGMGAGFPPPLQTSEVELRTRDAHTPLIGPLKEYGSDAEGLVGLPTASYPQYNLIPYPEINFGYATPGQLFVAKRNWWAFEMDLAGQDRAQTRIMAPRRQFVLSIYEIPSQLAISTSAFVSLGRHASGQEWSGVNIEGRVFAGKAEVEGTISLPSLSSRRGMTLSSDSTIGGQSFNDNPFAPGAREQYQLTSGEFYPVSLASESGRVAFIPINRGERFFDRFGHEEQTNLASLTSWNDYTVGALQCAMNLDVTAVNAQNKPTVLRFRAKNGSSTIEFSQPVVTGISQPLPPGYVECANEGDSHDFGDQVVDVAYGTGGNYYYESEVTGVVDFNDTRFGDPSLGGANKGYWRPAAPFKVSQAVPSVDPTDPWNVKDTSWRIEIYPERIPAFLAVIGASDTSINHSLTVNVDYTTSGINIPDYKPMSGNFEYGLILRECADLTGFTKGFSLVSNMRTFIADNFNIEPATPPAGYTPTGDFFPPVSLFVPEKRFGSSVDPTAVRLDGQVGSLAAEDAVTHLLDTKGTSGTDYTGTGGTLQVNLRPIDHPAALPPITMMNWLVVLEELRTEHTAP